MMLYAGDRPGDYKALGYGTVMSTRFVAGGRNAGVQGTGTMSYKKQDTRGPGDIEARSCTSTTGNGQGVQWRWRLQR